jgi:ABC-type lipoprotein export system ATPase subunit
LLTASDFVWTYGKTVIMVSHDPKTVEHFPMVYSMRDGEFVKPA